MSIGVKRKTVKLLEYDPDWKNEYLKEKNILKKVLASYDVDIQHVGSTAIHGCKAKPIIDIAIGVPNLEYGKKLIPILQSLGYYYDGTADFNARYFLKKCNNGEETYFIHIEGRNSRIWQNHIIFRDYMNLNPGEVEKYSLLKQNLAQKFCNNRKSYTKAKEKYIDEVINKALSYFHLEPKGENYKM